MTGKAELPLERFDMDRIVTAVWWLARGYSYKEVAEKVNTTPEALQGTMKFFGVKGRALPNGARRFDVVASAESVGLVESASGLRCCDPAELVDRVNNLVSSAPQLLRNVLDDGREVS